MTNCIIIEQLIRLSSYNTLRFCLQHSLKSTTITNNNSFARITLLGCIRQLWSILLNKYEHDILEGIMLYKNIMLAVDGSDASDTAIEEVIKLVTDQDVRLQVIHVVDESIFFTGGPSFDYNSLIVELRQQGQTILDAAAQRIESQTSIKVEKYLLEQKLLQGRMAELIIEKAQNWPADVLVLGSHGRRGFSRFFLGSVAENIMRLATMPVLLVHSTQ